MRRVWSVGAWLVGLVLVVEPAVAQGALEGPLSAPASGVATPAPKTVPGKTARGKTALGKTARKPNKAAHPAVTAKRLPAQGATATPTEAAAHAAPNDPLSFGMKWNGSNDNAEQTRVQNYGGGAQGTGAEVGMKLHF